MKKYILLIVMVALLAGCAGPKVDPLGECLLTSAPRETMIMRLNDYLKNNAGYTKSITSINTVDRAYGLDAIGPIAAVESRDPREYPGSFHRNFGSATQNGRIVYCESLLYFDDNSYEKGRITNEKKLNRIPTSLTFLKFKRDITDSEHALLRKENEERSASIRKKHAAKKAKNEGKKQTNTNQICLQIAGKPETISCTPIPDPDDYYEYFPETPEDHARNAKYLLKNPLHTCERFNLTDKGVYKVKYVVSDPKDCQLGEKVTPIKLR